jgi:hypothetical protein
LFPQDPELPSQERTNSNDAELGDARRRRDGGQQFARAVAVHVHGRGQNLIRQFRLNATAQRVVNSHAPALAALVVVSA